MTAAERDVVTWPDLEALVKELAKRVGGEHDVILAITDAWVVYPFKYGR